MRAPVHCVHTICIDRLTLGPLPQEIWNRSDVFLGNAINSVSFHDAIHEWLFPQLKMKRILLLNTCNRRSKDLLREALA